MNLTEVKLPPETVTVLKAIYDKAREYNPDLSINVFFQQIINDWLELFKRKKDFTIISKEKVVLKNRVNQTIKRSFKTQTQISKETGLSRTYINQVANGRYEPSISVALLLANATNCSVEEMFYFEPK
ncbi:MAG TPA: hypothetical protein DCZ10_19890 [Pelotomaculum sp.]|nr:hypothetical protein [Pelotomaculum sp.]